MLDDIKANPPSSGKLGLVEYVIDSCIALALCNLVLCQVEGRHLNDGNGFGFGVLQPRNQASGSDGRKSDEGARCNLGVHDNCRDRQFDRQRGNCGAMEPALVGREAW